MALSKTTKVEVRAVQLAAKLIQSMPRDALSKADTSPVTAADVAAQLLINAILIRHFPNDQIIAEEDFGTFEKFETDLKSEILCKCNAILKDEFAFEIDLANIEATLNRKGNGNRIWAVDPIDGTKGFLRNEQYAVCLALIVDGIVQIGVLGCPNYSLNGTKGTLFYAERNHGAFWSPINDLKFTSIKTDASCNVLVESVTLSHEPKLDALNFSLEKMDSQCKYAAIACGKAVAYHRFIPCYREKIWDHAAGALIVEEAGGAVSDAQGIAFDFSRGDSMQNNYGIVAAANEDIRARIVATVKQ